MLKTIHRMQRNERGFTLVELLIVVAIIAILAAIAIPNFTRYRQNAARAACESDLKNCINACAAGLSSDPTINNYRSTCTASPSCANGTSFNVDCYSNGNFSGELTGTGAYNQTCNIVNNTVNCPPV